MKSRKDTFVKTARDLKAGDEIISSRMTVVEIAKVENSEWRGLKSVHLTFIADQGGTCFKESDLVLTLEGGYGDEMELT